MHWRTSGNRFNRICVFKVADFDFSLNYLNFSYLEPVTEQNFKARVTFLDMVQSKLYFSIEFQNSSTTRSISPGPAGVGGAPLGERLDYLLLGQEEYLEHHSEITHCRFTTSIC